MLGEATNMEWMTAEDHSAVNDDETLREYLSERPALVLTVLDLAGRYDHDEETAAKNDPADAPGGTHSGQ